MNVREIFFDNNATTQPLAEVTDAVLRTMGPDFGNASSANAAGDRARTALLQARERVGTLIGAPADRIVFTSCGTESNNLVLSTAKNSVSLLKIVTTPIEHSSILKHCERLEGEGVDVVFLPVGSDGRIDSTDLKEAIAEGGNFVSIQWVNNETGVVQPIEEFSGICRELEVPFHTDAAQAVGKIPISINELPVGYLSFTGHKIHAPQGVGVLYHKSGFPLKPMIVGGPQESEIRGGTENLPGIIGLGVAAHARQERFSWINSYIGKLRDRFETRIINEVPGVSVNGDPECRVANTSNLLFRDVDGQALVARLDQVGIRVSQSSACTNQRPEPSYVLRAMGLTEDQAYSSVRFSFSILNTLDEVDFAVGEITKICSQLRQFGTSVAEVL